MATGWPGRFRQGWTNREHRAKPLRPPVFWRPLTNEGNYAPMFHNGNSNNRARAVVDFLTRVPPPRLPGEHSSGSIAESSRPSARRKRWCSPTRSDGALSSKKWSVMHFCYRNSICTFLYLRVEHLGCVLRSPIPAMLLMKSGSSGAHYLTLMKEDASAA